MSVGPIDGYTGNYKFSLISYDFPRWQSYEHDNWTLLDTTLAVLFGGAGISGIWKNGVTYNINERLIDEANNTLYLCLVDHTTPDTGLFSDERTANPSYWRSLSFVPANRGLWAAGVQYATGDFVQFGNAFAVCTISHLSINFINDENAGYWTTLVDLSAYNPVLALAKAANLSDLPSVPTARTNLGLGTVATHNDVEYFRVGNNLSEGAPSVMRTSLGLGSSAVQGIGYFLNTANNLSDLANVTNARINLGLGSLATLSVVPVATTAFAGGIPPLPATSTNNFLRDDNTYASPYFPGEIKHFSGLFVPSGWLLADGSSYATATYPLLYASLVASATVTFTNANPAVVTWPNHGLRFNYPVTFSATAGTLPTGITAGQTYYVMLANNSQNSFQISASPGGAAVSTSTNVNVGTYVGVCAPYGVSGANFTIPDYRGAGIRGLDLNRGFDINRVIGAYQADAFASHGHGVADPTHAHPITDPTHTHPYNQSNTNNTTEGGGSGGAKNAGGSTGTTSAASTGITIRNAATGITINNTGDVETRGKNNTALICIRAV